MNLRAVMRIVRRAVLVLPVMFAAERGQAQGNTPILRDPAIDLPAAADPAVAAVEQQAAAQESIESATGAEAPAPVFDAGSSSDAGIGSAPALPALIVDDPAAAAERVVNQFHEALRSGTRDTLLAVLAPEVTVFDNGRAAHSRNDYQAFLLDAELLDAQHAQRQLIRREVFTREDTVWVLSECRVVRVLAGNEVSFDEAETMMLRRQSETWMILHRHLSARPIAP